jgi:hypothetical protein
MCSQIWIHLHNQFQDARPLPFKNNKIQPALQSSHDKNDLNRIRDSADSKKTDSQPENLVSAKRLTLKLLSSSLRQYKEKTSGYVLIIKIFASARKLASSVTWAKSMNSFLGGKNSMRGYPKLYIVEPHNRKLGRSSSA